MNHYMSTASDMKLSPSSPSKVPNHSDFYSPSWNALPVAIEVSRKAMPDTLRDAFLCTLAFVALAPLWMQGLSPAASASVYGPAPTAALTLIAATALGSSVLAILADSIFQSVTRDSNPDDVKPHDTEEHGGVTVYLTTLTSGFLSLPVGAWILRDRLPGGMDLEEMAAFAVAGAGIMSIIAVLILALWGRRESGCGGGCRL